MQKVMTTVAWGLHNGPPFSRTLPKQRRKLEEVDSIFGSDGEVISVVNREDTSSRSTSERTLNNDKQSSRYTRAEDSVKGRSETKWCGHTPSKYGDLQSQGQQVEEGRIQRSSPVADGVLFKPEEDFKEGSSVSEDDGTRSLESDLDKLDSVNRRYIVIDGTDVALSHGDHRLFSCRGIQLCVDWFRVRGHGEITAFVPHWRKEALGPDFRIKDQEILLQLERQRVLVFTPSRHVGGRHMVCHDDRYIVKLAAEVGGVVVSNDTFEDLIGENFEFRKVISERCLKYVFDNGRFTPLEPPHGQSLDAWLCNDVSLEESDAPTAWNNSEHNSHISENRAKECLSTERNSGATFSKSLPSVLSLHPKDYVTKNPSIRHNALKAKPDTLVIDKTSTEVYPYVCPTYSPDSDLANSFPPSILKGQEIGHNSQRKLNLPTSFPSFQSSPIHSSAGVKESNVHNWAAGSSSLLGNLPGCQMYRFLHPRGHLSVAKQLSDPESVARRNTNNFLRDNNHINGNVGQPYNKMSGDFNPNYKQNHRNTASGQLTLRKVKLQQENYKDISHTIANVHNVHRDDSKNIKTYSPNSNFTSCFPRSPIVNCYKDTRDFDFRSSIKREMNSFTRDSSVYVEVPFVSPMVNYNVDLDAMSKKCSPTSTTAPTWKQPHFQVIPKTNLPQTWGENNASYPLWVYERTPHGSVPWISTISQNASREFVRLRLFYHFAAIFPVEHVEEVRKMLPVETNPRTICAAILERLSKYNTS